MKKPSDLEHAPNPTADRTDDQIERLLRATGRRPAVPADRTARVKAATQEHWRHETRRRSRRRAVWAVAGLATAASLLAVVGPGLWQRAISESGSVPIVRVERVLEPAWSQAPGPASGTATSRLQKGDTVAIGSELATEDRGGLALRLASGHSLRLDQGTRVRLVSDRVISLERGAVYVDSRTASGAATGFVEVQTALGNIRDIGTQFEARLTDSLRVRVREGKITLTSTDGNVEVGSGLELEIGQNGEIVQRELDRFGDAWSWLDRVTPMLAIEGLSLQDFLNWIARERGLRVVYANTELATTAPEILLNGSIDGMTLDQALDSVLPTCRMSHRIDGDRLFIRSSAGPRAAS